MVTWGVPNSLFALLCSNLAQPYLMKTVKVTRPTQLFDKDSAKLSRVMAGMPLWFSRQSVAYLGDFYLVFVHFENSGLMESLL